MDLRDPDSFARAYAEHAPAAATAAAAILAPAGRRADVEDVVHDVFVRVWRDPKGFDPARGLNAARNATAHIISEGVDDGQESMPWDQP